MTAGASLPACPPSLDDRHVFSAQGVVFTVSDIAHRAVVGGREVLLADGSPAQVEETFRRSRGLLTADALEAWLATWVIEPDDFRAWTHDAAAGTTTASAWCALVCSGAFDAAVARLVTAAAAACELGSPPTTATSFDPDGWVDRLLARTSTQDLTAAVDAHRLDWTALDAVALEAPTRPVAEELRHQVLAGADVATVAATAGLPTRAIPVVLRDVAPASLRSALAGARAGEVVGPVPTDGGWTVVSVTERREPDLTDPGTRALAEATVRDDVVKTAVARHVVA